MTRFGRWFAGVVLMVVALFIIGLLMPGGRHVVPIDGVQPYPPPAPADAYQTAPSGLVIPVTGIHPAQLTDTFGDPRGTEGERGHGALDIMAPRGTPVLAAAAGTIEKVFESALGGHTLYIRSPNRRNVYYYAHLDTYAPNIREGVRVRAGQRIATVGSTGDASPDGPHLHFEIKRVVPEQSWHEGAAIDPYPLLAGKPAGG